MQTGENLKTIPHKNLWLIGIFLFAFVVRLIFCFQHDPLLAYAGGGDSGFYLQVGRDLVGGLDYSGIPIPVPPVYLMIVGVPQQFLSPEQSIYFLWIFQSFLLALSCLFAFHIATQLVQDERVGLVVAIALATSVTMILEAGIIQTEAVYVAFLLLAMWLYIDGFMNDANSSLRQNLCLYLVGIVLGLAALTRPVLMLFPIGIAIHMLLIRRWQQILLFLVAYAFIFFSWTAFTSLYYEWTVIGSNQLLPAIWRGAVEGDGSPEQNDELLGEQSALEQTGDIISSNPTNFAQRRIAELASAYLQPHGTLSLGSGSLKTLALNWIRSGFSGEAFQEMITAKHFFWKLLIYIWHYIALVAGMIGMWLTRKNWRISLVLIGYIAYTTLLHLVALAIPRYIFPTFPFFWIFAAVTLVYLWDMLRGKTKEAELTRL